MSIQSFLNIDNNNDEKDIILVVEDEPVSCEIVKQQLINNNFFVETSRDGIDALEKINKGFKPNLILLDIMMPIKDGYEICKELREKYSPNELPIIMLTTLNDISSIVKGFNCGANDYLYKPVENKELMARVKTHLNVVKLNNKLIQTNKLLENEIIERKNAQNSLMKANEQLKELVATKDKFISIIGHDLKNVFFVLINLAKIQNKLIDHNSKSKLSEIAKKLYLSINNAYNLFNNLLTWAKLQTGKTPFNPTIFSINIIINNSFILLNNYAQEKNIELIFHKENNFSVFADKNMIDAVIRNLVSNAIKYTKEGGKIEINTEQKINNIIIKVADNGVGIEDEQIKKIFKLETCSISGTKGEKGTGMGLILCKDYIKKNDGKIWFETKIGHGSTFFISLPINENNYF